MFYLLKCHYQQILNPMYSLGGYIFIKESLYEDHLDNYISVCKFRTGEMMTLWLRACTAFAADLSLIPSTHTG